MYLINISSEALIFLTNETLAINQ